MSRAHTVRTSGSLALLVAAASLALAACGGSSSTNPPPPPGNNGAMFITDFSFNSISVYGQGSNCNCGPARFVQGGNTGLSGPAGIAVDAAGNAYVANENVSAVRKYAPGSSGNSAPTFTIGGLDNPIGVAVDGAGRVYVANSAAGGLGSPSIQVFNPGATVPVHTITGASTGLSTPGYLALDAAGNIWVANIGGNSVEMFRANQTGNVPPTNVISGSNTLLSRPQGIAFDSFGRLYVAINNPTGALDAVLIFSAPLNGNIAPSNILCGVNTGVNNPTGIAVNAQGTLFVVSSAFGGTPGYVTIFASNNIGGGTGCSGPFPNATVAGANTTFVNPAGIALH